MAKTFAEQVGTWARQTEQRMERVFQVSVADLGFEMVRSRANGGTLPWVTGNMGRSVEMSTNAPPRMGEPDQRFTGIDVGAAAFNLRLGQTAYLGYQAVYTRRQNYGFVGTDSLGRTYNQPGAFFLERAHGMWTVIVTRATAKVKGI